MVDVFRDGNGNYFSEDGTGITVEKNEDNDYVMKIAGTGVDSAEDPQEIAERQGLTLRYD